ncbi:MAG: 30S ribosomal protein S18 [Planctomycetota bacterium]|jgi:small subunit ribosomal protein S18
MARKPEPILKKVRCKFCSDKVDNIDYKDINLLQKLSSVQGKMYGRKRLGTCARHQRQIQKAIKRARFLALMRYVGK